MKQFMRTFYQFYLMKHILLFILWFLACLPVAYGQKTIEGYVYNRENEPVPYTSIYDSASQQGTYSDMNGYFRMNVAKLPVTLKFSNVGYETKEVKIDQPSGNRIILEQKIVELDEVSVYASHPESSYIGSPKNKRGIYLYVTDRPYHQLAIKIDNHNGELYSHANLVSFSLKIFYTALLGDDTVKPDGSKQLRLRMYKIDTLGSIGADILHKNIFLTPQKGGWYNIWIRPPFLLPEQGFFIAIEWLEGLESIAWKSKKYSGTAYGLEINGHEFKKTSKYYSTWIYDPDKNKWSKDTRFPVHTIPTFRLEIKEYGQLENH